LALKHAPGSDQHTHIPSYRRRRRRRHVFCRPPFLHPTTNNSGSRSTGHRPRQRVLPQHDLHLFAMFRNLPTFKSLPQAIGLPFLSSAEDAQVQFKAGDNGLKRLSGEDVSGLGPLGRRMRDGGARVYDVRCASCRCTDCASPGGAVISSMESSQLRATCGARPVTP
jgi:hypothetical protein